MNQFVFLTLLLSFTQLLIPSCAPPLALQAASIIIGLPLEQGELETTRVSVAEPPTSTTPTLLQTCPLPYSPSKISVRHFLDEYMVPARLLVAERNHPRAYSSPPGRRNRIRPLLRCLFRRQRGRVCRYQGPIRLGVRVKQDQQLSGSWTTRMLGVADRRTSVSLPLLPHSKTTLLKCIAQLVVYQKGEIQLRGK